MIKSSCVCPGYILTIECTVNGTSYGITTWRGDSEVFVCHGMEITLLHNRFTTDKDECNNGSVHVIGKGLKVEGNQYTSQLNVTLKENMIGKTIECYYEGGGQTLVDSVTINTTGKIMSATHIDLVLVCYKACSFVSDAMTNMMVT